MVRGFDRDIQDAQKFLSSGMVEPERFRALVRGIPDKAYTRYPAISRLAVLEAVEEFLSQIEA